VVWKMELRNEQDNSPRIYYRARDGDFSFCPEQLAHPTNRMRPGPRSDSDTKITAKIKGALLQDKMAADSNIHVTTVDGIVTLSGSVPSSDAAAHAERLAKQPEGVKQVKNALKISRSAVLFHARTPQPPPALPEARPGTVPQPGH
jgi:hyperosmotically inducible periplasmic protein